MRENLGPQLADARRLFDETTAPLRPELHRFCTRMTGNPCDGEDVLQDALVTAFYRLGELREFGAIRTWLFRIAHSRCIDFLRARRRFEELGDDEEGLSTMDDQLDDKCRTERALSRIVTELPPRERACVVLKDILDWSLEETAQITDSSVGAVKAALHRGRAKLATAEAAPPRSRRMPPDVRTLAERYVVAFNARDWDAVHRLLAEDARLEVVDRIEGLFREAPYFVNYGNLPWPWKLALTEVDGVERVVHFRRQQDGTWCPHSVVDLRVDRGAIAVVRDYVHVDYLLDHCTVTAP